MRKRKDSICFFLIVLLLTISLGYALLSTDLTITGTSSLKGNSWDIHFENLKVSQGSVSLSTGDSAAVINPTTKTSVSYTITLSKPGDFYEFTVDAVNAGSIDGMVDTVSSKMNNVEITTLPAYLDYSVTYSDDVEIEQDHLLSADSTETYKVRVDFKKDISQSDLPTTNQTFAFSFSVTYIQADEGANPVSHPEIVYTVNKYNYSTTIPKWNAVWLSQAFPESITKYQSPSEALNAIATASSKELPFYLKHKIENGIVTESYVEFVVTEAIASANLGMVPGTYILRGKKTYDLGSTYPIDESYISPYYEVNKEVIKTAFGYTTNPSRCVEVGTGYSSYFYCSVYGLNADANADGSVNAYDSGSSRCYVNYNGYTYCDW